MARNKQEKLRQISERPNVIEPGGHRYETWKGNWRNEYFKNANPIVVELGCGRGEYTVGLAAIFPEKNFIGIDVKGDRLWKGSSIAQENGLRNVAFLRMQIRWLDSIFAPGEIDEIWLTFPDPQSKIRRDKHRLTHPSFLEIYQRVMIPEGTVHLKTDSDSLMEYTLEVLQKRSVRELYATKDLYQSELNNLHHGIKTHFEEKFTTKGLSIKYVQFKFSAQSA